MKFCTTQKLTNASGGGAITNLAISNGITVTTNPIAVNQDLGFMSIILSETQGGGTGNIDAYAEWSLDGTNFFRANTTSAGALTQEANIVTGLANANQYIVMTPRLAQYVRFKFTANADSTLTALLAQQDEN